VGRLARLVTEGKVRRLGLCGPSPSQLRRPKRPVIVLSGDAKNQQADWPLVLATPPAETGLSLTSAAALSAGSRYGRHLDRMRMDLTFRLGGLCMRRNPMSTALPKLAAPARRALAGAGYTHLEQLAEVTESDLLELHGMGPNAIAVLRHALKEHGLSFRER
jgi:hypothetical protein